MCVIDSVFLIVTKQPIKKIKETCHTLLTCLGCLFLPTLFEKLFFVILQTSESIACAGIPTMIAFNFLIGV